MKEREEIVEFQKGGFLGNRMKKKKKKKTQTECCCVRASGPGRDIGHPW